MASVQDYILLQNGSRMPIIGFGTWGLVGEDLKNSLDAALQIGYRHIDTAYFHFNEDIIGSVLREWLESKRIKREELFLTSKLPPTGMQPEKVKYFCELSLQKLGLSYLDLYLIQLPVGIKYKNDEDLLTYYPDGSLALDCTVELSKVWKEMENLVDEGLVKNIGVSNFTVQQMETLMQTAIIKPANLQIEINAYFQQLDLRTFCHENKISVTAYCPLGSPGRDSMLFSYNDHETSKLLRNPTVLSIAEKCDRTPAQILLRHATQKFITVIPSSSQIGRIRENFEIFDFYLIPCEMKELNSLNKGQYGRSFDYSFLGESFISHSEFPFALYEDENAPPPRH